MKRASLEQDLADAKSGLRAGSAALLGNARLSPNSNAAASPRIMPNICSRALSYCKPLTETPGTDY